MSRGRGTAGRYADTVGSPVIQNRQGRSGSPRSPTRGPVDTSVAGSPGSRVTGPVTRSLPLSAQVDAERPAQPGRATRQVAVRAPGRARPGQLDPLDDLPRPQQHRAGGALDAGDHVAAHVHAVGEVAVEVAGRAEHDRVARRPAAVGVRAGVVRAVVGLDLGEPDAPPRRGAAPRPAAAARPRGPARRAASRRSGKAAVHPLDRCGAARRAVRRPGPARCRRGRRGRRPSPRR